MCWNMPNGENCKQCQILFDSCTHKDAVDFNDGKGKYCIFCEKREDKATGVWYYESVEDWTVKN